MSPPNWRERMYAEGAVGVINAIINTAAATPVSPVYDTKAAVTNGFNPNCAIDDKTMGLKWPLIPSSFSAAPTAKSPKGNAARPTISRISSTIIGNPMPLRLINQPIVQPMISGLPTISFINCSTP